MKSCRHPSGGQKDAEVCLLCLLVKARKEPLYFIPKLHALNLEPSASRPRMFPGFSEVQVPKRDAIWAQMGSLHNNLSPAYKNSNGLGHLPYFLQIDGLILYHAKITQ